MAPASADANNAVFEFQVNPVNGPTVTVSDLTIRGGYRGVNAGRFIRLILRNVVIRDNGPGSGAGVINNASVVTIINSTIRNNTADDPAFGCDGSGGAGGGIGSLCGGGSFTVINSAIVNNWARAGGGAVFVNGEQTIINSTFSGNTALDIGSAMMSFADNTFISNSTFANNTARPGGGALAMFSATNELKANLLAGNTGDNCLLAEPLDSLGYNVSSDGSCALTGPGDLLNASALLGPLQNNGGPTPTHALLPGPGLDHVPASICPAPATDQRGVERAQRSACDSGAFEATDQTPPVISVPSGITVNATTPGGAAVSFTATASDAFDGNLVTTCVPASGSIFAVGDTTVTCTASDSAGNMGSASFVVHVAGADEQLAALFELVSAVHDSDDLQALVLNAQAALLRDRPWRVGDLLDTLEQRVDKRARKNGRLAHRRRDRGRHSRCHRRGARHARLLRSG